MKKTLTLVVVLAFMLAMCMPAQAAVTPKGEFPIVDEPTTLTVAMPISAKVEDINTNQLTLWIEEQTGVDLEFIELTDTDVGTQVNMLMNSGDLPDIVLAYDFPYDVLCGYADAGLLAPLEDYFEPYGQNVYDVMLADLGENAVNYVSYDGHIWAMPNGGSLITDQYGGLISKIQTHFLEALDMEMPHTLDELYDFLVAVRDNDVNGNGDPNDEIPMTTYADNNYVFENISNAYQYTDATSYLKVTEDGTVEFIANNELFKEALEFTKKLVDENLLDPASFTQDMSVLSTVLAQDGDNVGVIACGSMYTNCMDSEGDEYQNMRTLPNLEGPHGYKSTLTRFNKPVRRTMVVTSACEQPEVAFRLFDFLCSDESALAVRVGFEGEQWKVADEGVIARDGQQAWFSLLTTQEWVQPSTNVIWDAQNFIHSNIMNHAENAQTAAKYPTATDIVDWKMVEEDTHEYLPQLLMSAEDEAEYNELKTMIVDSVEENIAMFVLGDRSLDEFDAYVSDLERMGLERYIELAQMGYDSVK